MYFYCNSSIESIQSCGYRCRRACFCPYRPWTCCVKHEATPVAKKRSRFGDIFKGLTPNLEELNYYRNKHKTKTNVIGSEGGRKKGKSLKGGGRGKGVKKKQGRDVSKEIQVKGGGKGVKKREGRDVQKSDQVVEIVRDILDQGGKGKGDKPVIKLGTGNKGGKKGKYDRKGDRQIKGTGSASVSGGEYENKQGGGLGGETNRISRDQVGFAGDDGAYNNSQWRKPNECIPNQLMKCPQTCTLKPKKCMPNQIGPCHPECLKGKPYNEPIASNYPGMGFENQPFIPPGDGLFCAQGGLQRSHSDSQNWQNVPSTGPQYCIPQIQQLHQPRLYQDMGNIFQYCRPKTKGSIDHRHQNYGNLPAFIPQYFNPQIRNGNGISTYNMQPPPTAQYRVNSIEMYGQRGGLQGYMGNPLSHQQNYNGIQQLQTISPNYAEPFQSTVSPLMVSNYLQEGDGICKDACPAIYTITCKKCGRPKKFTLTPFVKPNSHAILTPKEIKSQCSQTIG